MSKLNKYLIIGSIVVSFIFGNISGWGLHKRFKPCPEITTDTITVVDTSWYSIEDSLNITIDILKERIDYLKSHRDTIKIPGDTIIMPSEIDTAAILKDYYTFYKYGLTLSDSNINVVDSLLITQNVPVWHKMYYQIMRPQQVIINNIDNSVTYNKYLQFGLSIPVYDINKVDEYKLNMYDMTLDLTYSFKKGYLGVMWNPNHNYLSARFGANIIKFKNK